MPSTDPVGARVGLALIHGRVGDLVEMVAPANSAVTVAGQTAVFVIQVVVD